MTSVTTTDKGLADIKAWLEMAKHAKGELPEGIDYTPESYLLEKAREYPIGPQTFAGPRMEAKQCFMNAYNLATDYPKLYTYCEGLCQVVIPVEHAWVIDRDGFVVEPTLRQDTTFPVLAYFGVPFEKHEIEKWALRRSVYGILDHNRELYAPKLYPRVAKWR